MTDTHHDDEDEDEDDEEWNQILDVNNLHETLLGNQVSGIFNSTEESHCERDDGAPCKHENEDAVSSSDNKPVSRMALNDHKAGMEGLDREKINKIIHDASKGSKFFENEKRNEKRVLEKIESMKAELKRFNAVDRKKALVEANKVVDELSKGIDLSRTLVHIDMDAFYAAVEMRDNPALKDLPMAVGGMGMLSTSNYAARKFGVRAAMPGFIGKKLCPQLVIVPPHFDKYRAVSSDVRAIFEQYDSNYLAVSLDEAYLDLTDYMKKNAMHYNDGDESYDIIEEVVNEIRVKIVEKTQLTASAGIGPNLMLSKICSDMNKPNGQYFLKPDFENIKAFMKDLPIRKISGIGRVSEQMLREVNVEKCGDLIDKRDILYLLFSASSFRYFMNVAFGRSSNRIIHEDRKSMSAERTFSNVSNKGRLLEICYDLCKNVEVDLARENLRGYNVTLKYKLSCFVTKTRSKTVLHPVFKTDELYKIAKGLLLKEIQSFGQEKFELRLMGIRVSNFKTKASRKQHTVDSLFANKLTSEKTPCESNISTKLCDSSQNTDVLNSNINTTSCYENVGACPSVYDSEKDQIPCIDNVVLCPICNQTQKNESGSLNSHIDKCLYMQSKEEKKSSMRMDSNDSLFMGNVCPNEEGHDHHEICVSSSLSNNSLSVDKSVDVDKPSDINYSHDKQHGDCYQTSDTISHRGSVLCPVCGLPQTDEDISLNVHIDACLLARESNTCPKQCLKSYEESHNDSCSSKNSQSCSSSLGFDESLEVKAEVSQSQFSDGVKIVDNKDYLDTIQCPICGQRQQNEELSLNSHIDNCLTKQTIKEIINEQELEMDNSDIVKRRESKAVQNNDNQTHKRKSTEHSNVKKKVTLHSFWEKK